MGTDGACGLLCDPCVVLAMKELQRQSPICKEDSALHILIALHRYPYSSFLIFAMQPARVIPLSLSFFLLTFSRATSAESP
jgi:hypothetical protein